MKCKILHESAGRIRVHLNCRHMTLHQADVLEYYLRNVDGVREVSVFDRTQDAVIVYRADRAALVHALAVVPPMPLLPCLRATRCVCTSRKSARFRC